MNREGLTSIREAKMSVNKNLHVHYTHTHTHTHTHTYLYMEKKERQLRASPEGFHFLSGLWRCSTRHEGKGCE